MLPHHAVAFNIMRFLVEGMLISTVCCHDIRLYFQTLEFINSMGPEDKVLIFVGRKST